LWLAHECQNENFVFKLATYSANIASHLRTALNVQEDYPFCPFSVARTSYKPKEPTSAIPIKEWHGPGMKTGNDRHRGRQTCLDQPIGVREMASQIVMDRTGDTRHIFDKQDRAEVAKAEQRFKELTGAGFTAALRTGPGEQRIIRSFDPTADETLFYPRLVGG
jgi:hypothetical protein